jgi:hypothetical protein
LRCFQDNGHRIIGRVGTGDSPIRQSGPAVSGLTWVRRWAKPGKADRDATANGSVVREQRLLAHEQEWMRCSRGLEMRDVRPVQKELPLAIATINVTNDQAARVQIEAKSVRDRKVRIQVVQGLRWIGHGL